MKKIRYLLAQNNIKPKDEDKQRAVRALLDGFNKRQSKAERGSISDIFTRKTLLTLVCIIIIAAVITGGIWFVKTANEWADAPDSTTEEPLPQPESISILKTYSKTDSVGKFVSDIHSSVVLGSALPSETSNRIYGNYKKIVGTDKSVTTCADSLYGGILYYNLSAPLFAPYQSYGQNFINDIVRSCFSFADENIMKLDFKASDLAVREGSDDVFFENTYYTPQTAIIGYTDTRFYDYVLVTDFYVSKDGNVLAADVDMKAKPDKEQVVTYRHIGTTADEQTFNIDASLLTAGTLYAVSVTDTGYTVDRVICMYDLSSTAVTERIYDADSSGLYLTGFNCSLSFSADSVNQILVLSSSNGAINRTPAFESSVVPYICDITKGERAIISDINNSLSSQKFVPLFIKHLDNADENHTLVHGYLTDGLITLEGQELITVIHIEKPYTSSVLLNGSENIYSYAETEVYTYSRDDYKEFGYPEYTEQLFDYLSVCGVKPLTQTRNVNKTALEAAYYCSYRIYYDYSHTANGIPDNALELFGRDLHKSIDIKQYIIPTVTDSNADAEKLINPENLKEISNKRDLLYSELFKTVLIDTQEFNSQFDKYTKYTFLTFSKAENGIIYDETGKAAGAYNSETEDIILFCSPYAEISRRTVIINSKGIVVDVSSDIYDEGFPSSLGATGIPGELTAKNLSSFCGDANLYLFDEVSDGIYAYELLGNDVISASHYAITLNLVEKTGNGITVNFLFSSSDLTGSAFTVYIGNFKTKVHLSKYGDFIAFTDTRVITYLSSQPKPGTFYLAYIEKNVE